MNNKTLSIIFGVFAVVILLISASKFLFAVYKEYTTATIILATFALGVISVILSSYFYGKK